MLIYVFPDLRQTTWYQIAPHVCDEDGQVEAKDYSNGQKLINLTPVYSKHGLMFQ